MKMLTMSTQWKKVTLAWDADDLAKTSRRWLVKKASAYKVLRSSASQTTATLTSTPS